MKEVYDKIQSDAMNSFLMHQNFMLNVMNEALTKSDVGAAAIITQMEQQNYDIFTKYNQYQTELRSIFSSDY